MCSWGEAGVLLPQTGGLDGSLGVRDPETGLASWVSGYEAPQIPCLKGLQLKFKALLSLS